MEAKQIWKKLSILRFVSASNTLHQQIHAQINQLPEKHSGFYFPLFAFQMGFVAVMLLVFVGLGSTVVLGAKESHPQSLLYPVKRFIQNIAPGIIHRDSTPMPFPTIAQPTEKAQIVTHPSPNKEKKDVRGINTQRNPHENTHKEGRNQ